MCAIEGITLYFVYTVCLTPVGPSVHGILIWCVNIHVCKFQFHGRLTVVQGFSVIHTYICSLASCVRMWQWYTLKKVSN